jgi:molybdate transport system substrate-binding protein
MTYLKKKRRQLLFASSAGLLTQPLSAISAPAAPEIFIAAASDLQFVLPEIIKQYNANKQYNPSDVKITARFGASATLATQIIRGLKTDVFLSADAMQVASVSKAGLSASESFVYAVGHLALAVSRNGSATEDARNLLDSKLQRLKDYFERMIKQGKTPKLAIANPAHAPYGMAAQQALSSLGQIDFFKPHLVLGENIAQTAQYVASASVTAGILGVALCKAPALAAHLQWVEIEKSTYAPIRQTAILVKSGSSFQSNAEKFLFYLKTDQAKSIFAQFGFQTAGL